MMTGPHGTSRHVIKSAYGFKDDVASGASLYRQCILLGCGYDTTLKTPSNGYSFDSFTFPLRW
jgi:hypothetical protein